MVSKDPPGPDPDRCAGWPLDRGCGKYDRQRYDHWERKKNLTYIADLKIWLCRPCLRKYKKRNDKAPCTND